MSIETRTGIYQGHLGIKTAFISESPLTPRKPGLYLFPESPKVTRGASGFDDRGQGPLGTATRMGAVR
ncbi:MAG: hypothetical protein KDA83_15310 [Planctomycetales bacterium]|nr:hypothetical protein [Planctomycetales bacterium]